jgi:NADH:ubiquinone oxidoreductase subunit H
MDFPIKVMVMVMIALISFIVIAALIGGWGSNTNSMLDGLFSFFSQLFGGPAP